MRDSLNAHTYLEAIAHKVRSYTKKRRALCAYMPHPPVGAHLVRDSLNAHTRLEAIAHKVRSYTKNVQPPPGF